MSSNTESPIAARPFTIFSRTTVRRWASIAGAFVAFLGVEAGAEEVEVEASVTQAVFGSAAWKDLVNHIRKDSLHPASEEVLRAACLEASRRLPSADRTTLDACLEGAIFSADPRGLYYTPRQTADSRNAAGKSTFVGIGLELGRKAQGEALVVVSPIAGAAGAQAGVRDRDTILEIDGQDVRPLTMDQTVRLLRGAAGTPITLTIERGSPGVKLTVTAIRAPIHIQTVRNESDWVEPKIAALRLTQFSAGTEEDLARRVDEILRPATEMAPKTLLVDLRANPGGSLDVMVRIAAAFTTADTIVARKIGRGGEELLSASTAKAATMEFSAPTREWLRRVRVAVLVDERTANGAEAFAQFLRERRGAAVFGTRTFGLAEISQVFPLGSDSSANLPIAELRSAKGMNWQGTGLTPDRTITATAIGWPEFGSPADTALHVTLAALRERGNGVAAEGGARIDRR